MGGHTILPLDPPPLNPPKSVFRTLEPRLPADVGDKQSEAYGFNGGDDWEPPDSYIRWIQPIESDLAKQCEYDMDEQDQEWLSAINAERRKVGTDAVSYEFFEIIMDRLEKEWFDLSRQFPKPEHLASSEDSKCAICEDGDTENSNAIVFCDGCNLAVHQDCYGVPYIPEGQWLCRKCTVSPDKPVACVLCPNSYGAFKQTSENQWAHLVCAIHVPETGVSNAMYMEPIDGVKGIPKPRWKLKCYICKKLRGACIQCSKSNCFTAYHVTCAQDHGLYLKIKAHSSHFDGPNETRSFCDRHSPKEHLEALEAAAEARTAADAALAESSGEEPRRLPPPPRKGDSLGNLRYLRSLAIGSHSSKSARAYRKTYHSGPPLVPAYIYNRVLEYTARLRTMNKKSLVAQICRYWSLKREARRGAPLLKRLHLEPWTAASSHKQQTEEDRAQKLILLSGVRKDLGAVRTLADLVRKRERAKLHLAQMQKDLIEEYLFPHAIRMRRVLSAVADADKANFFLHPVNRAEVPDYYEVITNPMDWTTIDGKLERHEYFHVSEFIADIRLTLNNARTYNKPETPFHKAALRVNKVADPLLIRLTELVDAHSPAQQRYAELLSLITDDVVQDLMEFDYEPEPPPPPPPPPLPKTFKAGKARKAKADKKKNRKGLAEAAAAGGGDEASTEAVEEGKPKERARHFDKAKSPGSRPRNELERLLNDSAGFMLTGRSRRDMTISQRADSPRGIKLTPTDPTAGTPAGTLRSSRRLALGEPEPEPEPEPELESEPELASSDAELDLDSEGEGPAEAAGEITEEERKAKKLFEDRARWRAKFKAKKDAEKAKKAEYKRKAQEKRRTVREAKVAAQGAGDAASVPIEGSVPASTEDFDGGEVVAAIEQLAPEPAPVKPRRRGHEMATGPEFVDKVPDEKTQLLLFNAGWILPPGLKRGGTNRPGANAPSQPPAPATSRRATAEPPSSPRRPGPGRKRQRVSDPGPALDTPKPTPPRISAAAAVQQTSDSPSAAVPSAGPKTSTQREPMPSRVPTPSPESSDLSDLEATPPVSPAATPVPAPKRTTRAVAAAMVQESALSTEAGGSVADTTENAAGAVEAAAAPPPAKAKVKASPKKRKQPPVEHEPEGNEGPSAPVIAPEVPKKLPRGAPSGADRVLTAEEADPVIPGPSGRASRKRKRDLTQEPEAAPEAAPENSPAIPLKDAAAPEADEPPPLAAVKPVKDAQADYAPETPATSGSAGPPAGARRLRDGDKRLPELPKDDRGFNIYPRAHHEKGSTKVRLHRDTERWWAYHGLSTQIKADEGLEDGTLVWGKIAGYSWFPGEFSHSNDEAVTVPQKVLDARPRTGLADTYRLIYFFDEPRSWQWIAPRYLRKFAEVPDMDHMLQTDAFELDRERRAKVVAACARAMAVIETDDEGANASASRAPPEPGPGPEQEQEQDAAAAVAPAPRPGRGRARKMVTRQKRRNRPAAFP